MVYAFGSAEAKYGTITLFGLLFQATYASASPFATTFRLQFSVGTTRIRLELLPLRSPLLRQSSLISFPPLSNMLKFSGCSCLISDAKDEWIYKLLRVYGSVVFNYPIEITEESVTNSMDPKIHTYIFNVRLGRSSLEGRFVKHIMFVVKFSDTETDMLYCYSASCVQGSDDSRNSAIRIAYRILLRSSSVWEPRYPSLKIF